MDSRAGYPLTLQKSIRLRPGHENHVAVSAVSVRAEAGVKDVGVEKRRCYFPNDTVSTDNCADNQITEHVDCGQPSFQKLSGYTNYSLSNCLLLCDIRYAHSVMKSDEKCVPWYLPNLTTNETTMCDPWSAANFRSIVEERPGTFVQI